MRNKTECADARVGGHIFVEYLWLFGEILGIDRNVVTGFLTP
jgi:hypothetical protein